MAGKKEIVTTDQAMKNELSLAINQQMIEALKTRYDMFRKLQIRQGYTKAQVTQILGVSPYTIHQWKFRGKEAFQKGERNLYTEFFEKLKEVEAEQYMNSGTILVANKRYHAFWDVHPDDEYCLSLKRLPVHLYCIVEMLLDEIPIRRIENAREARWSLKNSELAFTHPEGEFERLYQVCKLYDFIAWYDWQLKAFLDFRETFLNFYGIDALTPPLSKLFFEHNVKYQKVFTDGNVTKYINFKKSLMKEHQYRIVEIFEKDGEIALKQHETIMNKIKLKGLNIWG